jgi:hypothetical protein
MNQPLVTSAAADAATTRRQAVRVAASVVALVLGLSVMWFSATPADATSYRYWTYWSGDSGSWAFSPIGAARRPPNGGVEGWRFEVSPAASSSQPPRTAASFASICGGASPGAGKKRVALVIDYGTASDAPPGDHPPAGTVATCIEIDAAATGYDVLASKASIRAQSGLVCGIGGYPATGCGDATTDPTASPSPSHSHSGGGTASGTTASDTSSHDTSSGATSATGTKRNGGQGATQKSRPTPASSADAPGDASTPAASDSATPVAATSGNDASTGGPVGALVGVAVIALLAGGAWAFARTRRTP